MGVSIENRRWVERADFLRRVPAAVRFISAEPLLGPLDALDLSGIDWLIAGGESGHGHRLMQIEWARELRDRCEAEGVAFFFKQWGGPTAKVRRPRTRRAGALRDAARRLVRLMTRRHDAHPAPVVLEAWRGCRKLSITHGHWWKRE